MILLAWQLHQCQHILPNSFFSQRRTLLVKVILLCIIIHIVTFDPHPGPLPITITDFWRLVWQEGVETIAMVTNLQENLRKKCERYWPDISSEQHGPFKLTLVDTQMFANYVVRELHMEVSGMPSCLHVGISSTHCV